MKTIKTFFLISSLVLVFCVNAYARSSKVLATVVFAKGDVKLFHGEKKKRKYKSVLYEGKAYTYEKVKIGSRVHGNDIIHCGPNAKAKIVYGNGDHFTIDAGSSVQMPSAITKEKKPTLNMFYGKVRAMISKKGPRKNLKIRTKAAVAGVRGTDFFVQDSGVEGTKFTVLRGRVAIQAKSHKKKVVNSSIPQETVLSSGYSVKVDRAPEEASKRVRGVIPLPTKPPQVVVYEAPKEELLVIQKVSQVVVKPAEVKVSREVAEEIKKLEKASAKAVLDDIKSEDPKLYDEIKDQKVENLDEINTAVVSKLYKKAPKAKVKSKPTEDDIDELGGEEIYEKYFGSE